MHPSADNVSIQLLNTIKRQGAEEQLLGLQARQIRLFHQYGASAQSRAGSTFFPP